MTDEYELEEVKKGGSEVQQKAAQDAESENDQTVTIWAYASTVL